MQYYLMCEYVCVCEYVCGMSVVCVHGVCGVSECVSCALWYVCKVYVSVQCGMVCLCVCLAYM